METIMKVICYGRDMNGNVALLTPVRAKVEVGEVSDVGMSVMRVTCPHNHGGHGERCNASQGLCVRCVYMDLTPSMVAVLVR